ncbi:universal stress protein [Halorarum halophilum]|uniref:Universal stress protein n=1 Tax=Halorarum halophilum TaxID=2743090 RepID=A0A7D5K158_9EURY|nr:universal stress protein [Halobaculum halophilum]QLG27521.1 universal stress protein [Halobaculum halophilum]
MTTHEFDELLVPTDGSETADAALDVAVSLASHIGARVHLLSVVNPYVLSRVTDVEEHRAEARQLVSDAAERVREAGVDVETAVRKGSEHEEIREYVEEHGIDAVVMGTHGRTGVKRALVGSVTEKVVRRVGVPVLTVREPIPEFRPDRVLLPTDGSDAAAAAERVALWLADEYGATVEALSVVETPTLTTASDPAGMTGDAIDEVRGVLTEQAEDAVESVEEDGEAAGVTVETAVGEGRTHERILTAAEERDADLIVIGSHGRGGVERFVLGSVAEKVLRLADRPVLVVPSEGAGGTAG